MLPTFIMASIGAGGGLRTSLAGTKASHSRTRVGTCLAGVYIKNDGVEWSYSAAGAAEGTNLGDWLDVGTTAELWVRCTLNAGTLDGANSGTGLWLATTTSRGWAISDSTSGDGADTGNITLEMATDAGGSNIIDARSYALSAENVT